MCTKPASAHTLCCQCLCSCLLLPLALLLQPEKGAADDTERLAGACTTDAVVTGLSVPASGTGALLAGRGRQWTVV